MRIPDLRRSRVALALTLVVTAVAAGLSVSRLLDDDALPVADPATIELAHDFAIAVTSFDHRTASQDIAEVLAFGTGNFEADFREAMGEDFLAGIEQSRSISVGQVVAGPTLQSRVDGASTLLVVVNQAISSEVAGPAAGESAAGTTTTLAPDAAPVTPPAAPRIVRVGMLVTFDDESSKVSSVQIL